MATRADVLAATQTLVVSTGKVPSIAAVAQAVGLTKQGVLHYFPGRSSLDEALLTMSLERIDEVMAEARDRGDCATTYLRLSTPTVEDRAVAAAILAAHTRDPLPQAVIETMARWQQWIGDELGDPVRAEVVRLMGDGLFAEALLTGLAPSRARIDRLVSHVVGEQPERAS